MICDYCSKNVGPHGDGIDNYILTLKCKLRPSTSKIPVDIMVVPKISPNREFHFCGEGCFYLWLEYVNGFWNDQIVEYRKWKNCSWTLRRLKNGKVNIYYFTKRYFEITYIDVDVCQYNSKTCDIDFVRKWWLSLSKVEN